MDEKRTDTRNWPELAIGLYDRLTGRGAQIDYEFDALQVQVPSEAGSRAEHATWRLDGTVRIRTQDRTEA